MYVVLGVKYYHFEKFTKFQWVNNIKVAYKIHLWSVICIFACLFIFNELFQWIFFTLQKLFTKAIFFKGKNFIFYWNSCSWIKGVSKSMKMFYFQKRSYGSAMEFFFSRLLKMRLYVFRKNSLKLFWKNCKESYVLDPQFAVN